MEKNSPSSRATKSSFVGRMANFGNVSLFSSRGNKHVSELIHSLLKLPNCVLKQQPHILQLFEVLGSAFSLFEEQEQTLSAYCHFHSFIDLPENTTLYTETMLKTALELLEINYVQLSTQDLKPSANNNTHCSLAKTITRCIKFTKRVEL